MKVLLDLFCGAGGASAGYKAAGFDVIIGVDINPQPRYPFSFIQADALEFLKNEIEHNVFFVGAYHASPPCQRYSVGTKQHGTEENHPDLIAKVRELLIKTGKPYVIENVQGSPLIHPVRLCGSMFEREPMRSRLRRHRLFESNLKLTVPACRHKLQHKCISVAGHAGGSSKRDGAERFGSTALWKELMGIDWMTGKELAEAIPPDYTEFIGKQILEQIDVALY